jgi:hypothetical protein
VPLPHRQFILPSEIVNFSYFHPPHVPRRLGGTSVAIGTREAGAQSVTDCQETRIKRFDRSKSIQCFLDLQTCKEEDPKGKIAKACDPVRAKIRCP